MSWFDEQIQQRKLHDEELMQTSFSSLAGVVLGKKIANALENENILSLDAIRAVFRYYHIKANDIPDNVKGVNEQLEYLARPNGMMRRDVKLDKGWHRNAYGAMLGLLKEDSTVVALIPGKVSGYYFYDRKNGKNVKISSSNEHLFEDEAISFYKPFPLRPITALDLVGYVKNQVSGVDVFGLVLVSALISLVGTRLPVLTAVLYNDVVNTKSKQMFFGIAVAMLCIYISQAMFETLKSLVLSKINTKIQVSVEAATTMRILSLPASFFKNYSSGELASYMGHVNGLCQVIMNTIVSSGLTAVFSLVYITNIASFSNQLVLPSLGMILLTVLVTVATALLQIHYTRAGMKAQALESGLSFALISGIQKIKLTGAEKRAFAKWANAYSESAKYEYNQPPLIRYSSVITQAITLLGTFVMYYMAAKCRMSAADYSAFLCAYGMLSGAFLGVATITTSIASIRPTLDMAKPIMEAQPEVAEGKRQVSRLSGTIEMSHVSFQYTENTPKVLDDISLKIRGGQYVAIVGKTGCGKSTLMRLLLGFEKPQKGAVYYDSKDLETIELTSLRRKIGVVMQSGKLFNGDIFSNITIAAPWLTVDDAWEAAEIAGIADDIRDMPMGMYTMIGEGQGGISGGQKQRLMIARAVATKPKVLMMDEATSALDNITQKHVSEALDKLKCTRIVIAHRLSTIKQCDRIIVLDGGKIVEDGNYDTLLKQNGLFSELVRRQLVESVEA